MLRTTRSGLKPQRLLNRETFGSPGSSRESVRAACAPAKKKKDARAKDRADDWDRDFVRGHSIVVSV